MRRNATYFSQDHKGHTKPPPRILEVGIPFTRLFVVLFVRLQQTMLLNHKRDSDKQARCYGQTYANDLVRAWPRRRVAAQPPTPRVQLVQAMDVVGSIELVCAGVELVCRVEEARSRIHGVGAASRSDLWLSASWTRGGDVSEAALASRREHGRGGWCYSRWQPR